MVLPDPEQGKPLSGSGFFWFWDMARDTQRKQIDWEKIEVEYRAGVLSLREIAARHGITHGAIRKRAQRDDWDRDLSAKVRARAEALVSKAEVSTQVSTQAERDVVAVSARLQADKILEHRKDLVRLQEVEQKFVEELVGNDGEPTKRYITTYLGQIIEKDVPLSISEKASTLQALANVRTRRIELERKVFGIEDNHGEDKGDRCVVQITREEAMI